MWSERSLAFCTRHSLDALWLTHTCLMQTYYMGDACTHVNPQNKHQHKWHCLIPELKGRLWICTAQFTFKLIEIHPTMKPEDQTGLMEWVTASKSLDGAGAEQAAQLWTQSITAKVASPMTTEPEFFQLGSCCAHTVLSCQMGTPLTSSACCGHDLTYFAPNSVLPLSENNNYSQWKFSIV